MSGRLRISHVELRRGEVRVDLQPGLARDDVARGPRATAPRRSASPRRHCQTIALCSGRPVARSKTTNVSRWFVMLRQSSVVAAVLASTRRRDDGQRVLPDLLGVVLDPARLRVDLAVVDARPCRAAPPARVEEQRLGGRGALVDGKDVASWRVLAADQLEQRQRASAARPSMRDAVVAEDVRLAAGDGVLVGMPTIWNGTRDAGLHAARPRTLRRARRGRSAPRP